MIHRTTLLTFLVLPVVDYNTSESSIALMIQGIWDV
jgi:hypothetical protein